MQRRLDALTAANRYRSLRMRTGSATHGQPGVLSLCSNDYLGLAEDPRVVAGAREALERYGAGSTSARLIAGELPLFRALEESLAEWLGFEDALLFPTGYHANLALVSLLPGAGGRVLSDALNHASMIDGCRLSKVETVVFKHNCLSSVEALLTRGVADSLPAHAATPIEHRQHSMPTPTVILTEGMFSMDGDLAPSQALSTLARHHGALLLVDDAHALGTMGPHGKGSTFAAQDEAAPPAPATATNRSHGTGRSQADVLVGTFGKAFGSSGAFIVCPRVVREALINLARPFIFTTGPNPASVGAAHAALRVIQSDPEPRERLAANVQQMRNGLESLGFDLRHSPGHILPLIVGTEQRALRFSARLLEKGIDIRAIRPPTVPEGTCRLRLSLSAAHTSEELDQALETLAQVWHQLDT